VSNELEKNVEGSGHDLVYVISQYFPGGTEENHEKPVQNSKTKILELCHPF
jgi:hypothetical protein